jgi:hypothetical protein
MTHSCGRPHSPRLRRQYHEEERAPAVHGPTREEIARLAYSYWEARGRQGGSAEEDWFRAEQTLRG